MSCRLSTALLLLIILPALAVPPGTIAPRPEELQNPAVNTGRVLPGAARRLSPEQAKQLAARVQEILRRPNNEVIALPHRRQVPVGVLKQALARNVHVIGAPHPQRMRLLKAQLNVREQVNREAAAAHAALAAQLRSQPPTAATPAAAPAARATAAPEPAFLAATGNDARYAAAMRATDPHLPITQPLRAGVWGVNQHASGFVMTPGGNLTLTGNGFGVAPGGGPASAHLPGRVLPPGRVRALSAGFPNGALVLVVSGWSPQEISASVPAGLRGIADLSGVVLEVTTPDGHVYHSNPGSFYAAREEIPLPMDFFGGGPDLWWPVFGASQNWPVTPGAYGSIDRQVNQDGDFDCPKPGQDSFVFRFTNFGNTGFEVSGATLTVAAPVSSGDGDGLGNDGDRVFFPGYSIVGWDQVPGQDPGDTYWRVRFNWGVWRWHRSANFLQQVGDDISSNASTVLDDAVTLGLAVTSAPGAFVVGSEAYYGALPANIAAVNDSKNGCWSSYVFGITVVGPAGLSP